MKVSGIPFIQGRNDYTDTDGIKYGIAIHNTSNDASAEGEASYATRRTDGVSAHFYCDSDSVVQSLDTRDRAGHAGSRNGNENAIAVEITGVNSWSRDRWIKSVAWEKLGSTLAQVCKAHGIPVVRPSVATMKSNPKVKGFYSHDDMRRAWGGTTHTDPGPNFPWDVLFKSVSKYMVSSGGGNSVATHDEKVHAVWTAVFLGGSSCGTVVPEAYRVAGDKSNGNAIVDKLNYLQHLLEKIAAK